MKSLKIDPQQILEGNIAKTLFRLAVPTIIAFAFHTTFNFIDRFFVSRLGELEFGALGMAFTVQSIVLHIGSGVGIGASSLIARFIGAKKLKDANIAAEQTLIIILVLSAVISGIGPLLTRSFFLLLGASERMLPYILSYINIILYGSFFQLFAMIGNGILRGEGNMVTPMRVMLLGTLVNICLDPLLIFGIGPFPTLGVRGAAIASVAGRAASCAVLASALLSKKNIIKLKIQKIRINTAIIRGIFSVGGPTIIAHLSHSLGLSLLFILLRPYGDMAKAAFTMGFTYQQIAFLPLLGIAGATLTMTGQNFGARNYERIKLIIKQAVLFSMALMGVFACTFIIGRGTFTRVFSHNPDIIRIGKTLLAILSIGFPFMAARLVISSFFQGMGMGFKALFLSLAQMIIFSIPLSLLISLALGLKGIWIGMVLGTIFTALLGFLWAVSTHNKLEQST